MKPVPHFLPPRQSVIFGYTRRMLDETASNANTFAMALAEQYLRLVAPDVRTVPFRLGEGDELLKAIKNNAQILRRYMDGTIKVLPADLEDAWVMALPEPFRGACERDLAQRRGVLPVQLPTATEAGEAVGLSQLMTEYAQLLEAIAPALADGRISVADLPYLQKIVNEADDLLAKVMALRHCAQQVLKGERT